MLGVDAGPRRRSGVGSCTRCLRASVLWGWTARPARPTSSGVLRQSDETLSNSEGWVQAWTGNGLCCIKGPAACRPDDRPRLEIALRPMILNASLPNAAQTVIREMDGGGGRGGFMRGRGRFGSGDDDGFRGRGGRGMRGGFRGECCYHPRLQFVGAGYCNGFWRVLQAVNEFAHVCPLRKGDGRFSKAWCYARPARLTRLCPILSNGSTGRGRGGFEGRGWAPGGGRGRGFTAQPPFPRQHLGDKRPPEVAADGGGRGGAPKRARTEETFDVRNAEGSLAMLQDYGGDESGDEDGDAAGSDALAAPGQSVQQTGGQSPPSLLCERHDAGFCIMRHITKFLILSPPDPCLSPAAVTIATSQLTPGSP